MIVTLNIITGIISGIISGSLVSLYFRNRDQKRLIIEYANQTADNAHEIMMEAGRCLKGEDTAILTRLIEKNIHRRFDAKISKPLQEAIAACNLCVYRIKKALEQQDFHSPLFIAYNEMPDRLLNIWNAITDYESMVRKKQQRENKAVIVSFLILLFTCIAIAVYEYGLLSSFASFG